MELLFYSDIVSISHWKYIKSVGIKNQVSWAGPCSYINAKRIFPTASIKYLGVKYCIFNIRDWYYHLKRNHLKLRKSQLLNTSSKINVNLETETMT